MVTVKEIYERTDRAFFGTPDRILSTKVFNIVVLLLLYAAGLAYWSVFMHGGNLNYTALDWPPIYNHFTLLREAITSGQIPFHVSAPGTFGAPETDQFLGLPWIPWWPHTALLPWLTNGQFILFNLLLFYTIGYVGCLAIRRRYRLSLFPFLILYVLYNFNGFITARMAVGHANWGSYFLFPFYFLFVLELIEQRSPRAPVLKLSLLLFLMMLQGSYHLFVWCCILLTFIMLFNWRKYWQPILTTFVVAGLLSACRILPSMIAVGSAGNRKFLSGFPTFRMLFDGLTELRYVTWTDPNAYMGHLGWWEYDFFIGLVALAAIVYMGFYLRVRKDPELDDVRYRELDMPLALMAIAAMGNMWWLVTSCGIPLLHGERVTTRFLILPLLLLLVIGVIRLQRHLPRFNRSVNIKILALLGLVYTTLLLMEHSALWTMKKMEKLYPQLPEGFPSEAGHIITRPDPIYQNAVIAGACITGVAIVGVVVYAIIRRRGRAAMAASDKTACGA